MIFGLNIIIIVSLIIGTIVCIRGMKTKNVLYKGGFCFFLLSMISKIYSLIIPGFIDKLIENGVDNPGLWVRNLNIPSLLLQAASLVLFLIFLIMGLNYKSND